MILTLDMKNDLFVLDDATLDALGRPKQVQLLINTQQRKLVLRACSAEDEEPIFLPDTPIISTEISGRKLLQNIRTNMGWEDRENKLCPGTFLPHHKAVCFDLNRVKTAQ
jgi:hypothetical protein